jgi:hypothetical protein
MDTTFIGDHLVKRAYTNEDTDGEIFLNCIKGEFIVTMLNCSGY